MKHLCLLSCVAALMLVGCRSRTNDQPMTPLAVEPAMSQFTLTSSAFENNGPIPAAHAYRGEGDNISPPLAWSNAPANTSAFALIMDDPDAPSRDTPRPEGPWVHWVVINLPASQTALLAGDGNGGGADQGLNDFGEIGYGGPMPPAGSGPHRYVFTLYALDAAPVLNVGATKEQLLSAIEGHVLEKAKLTGTYER